MKLIDKLNDIKAYILKGEELWYNSKNEVFNNERKLILKSEVTLQSIKCDFSFLYVVDNEGNTYLIKDDKKIFLKSTFIKKALNNSFFLVSKTTGTKIYNIETNNFIDFLAYRLFHFLLNDNFLYFEENNSINSCSLFTTTPLWQLDLGSFGDYTAINNERHRYEIKFFLGVYKDCLLVQLSNATFIWLALNTGELRHSLCLNESHSLPKPVFYDDGFKAHIAGDKLVFLNNQRLLNIDLNSYEVSIVKDYYTEERDHQYRFMFNTFFDDKIYFVADYGWQYVTPSYVGVMDANDGEVLWKQQLQKTGGLSEAPQVTKEKLYIRTNNNVLHIFEKEE